MTDTGYEPRQSSCDNASTDWTDYLDTTTCNRRGVLATIGGAGVASTLPTGSVAGETKPGVVEPAASELEHTTHANTAVGLPPQPEDLPVTIHGRITTPPLTVEDVLLLGTTAGLYIFEGDELHEFVSTQPIERVRPLSADRAVVLTEERDFPNILTIDLTTGELLWSASKSIDVYNHEIGQVERQVPVFDAQPIGDTTGNGTPDVAVAAAYGIYAFDGDSGDQLWEVSRERYVWQLDVFGGTVYASTQSGELLAIDADSGATEFAVQLAESFEVQGLEIPLSVWDVVAVASGELAVTTESGALKLIDSDDGTVVSETQIIEFDDDTLETYFRRIDGNPTSRPDPGQREQTNFFNLELTHIDGGEACYAITVNEFVADSQNQEYLTYIGPNGTQEWSNSSVVLREGRAMYADNFDSEHLLIPQAPARGTQEIQRISLDSGALADPLEVPAVQTRNDISGGPSGTRDMQAFLGTQGNDLLVTSETTDIRRFTANEEIEWSFSSERDVETLSADFTGNGTDEYLIASQNGINQRRGPETRTLLMLDGEDGSVQWSKTMNTTAFQRDGGLRDLAVLPTSGGADLLALEQRPRTDDVEDEIRRINHELRNRRRQIQQLQEGRGDRSNEIETLENEIEQLEAELTPWVAQLVVLSGVDGSERKRLSLRPIWDEGASILQGPISITVVERGTTNKALVTSRNRLFLLDVDEETITWAREYDEIDGWPRFESPIQQYLPVQDGPGASDLLAIDMESAQLAFLEIDIVNGELQLGNTTPMDLAVDRIIPGSITTLGDQNGDGYQEIALVGRGEGGGQLKLIAPGEGQVVESFQSQGGTNSGIHETVGIGESDRGLVSFQPRGDEYIIKVFENLEQRWEFTAGMGGRRPRGGVTYQPAAPAGDIDGDGTEEIAIAASSPRGGAKIDLYNVASDERVDTITLERFGEGVDPAEDDLLPALHVERLPDRTGNGQPDLGVLVHPSVEGSEPSFYLVDPAEGEIVASTESQASAFLTLGQDVGLLNGDTSVRRLDLSQRVTLDGVSSATEQDLSWTYETDESYVSTVLVNQQPVAVTTENSATVRLPEGSHSIQIEGRNTAGVRVYDSETADVDGGSIWGPLLWVGTSVSVLALFGFALADIVRRRVLS